jgi:hypothetical protein
MFDRWPFFLGYDAMNDSRVTTNANMRRSYRSHKKATNRCGIRVVGVVAFVLAMTLCVVSLHAEMPRPEHPRPDAFRPNWLTLNGPWQFENDKNDDGDARGLVSGEDLASTIIVPFCPESKL